jgi:hypothetical protein
MLGFFWVFEDNAHGVGFASVVGEPLVEFVGEFAA